MSEIRYRMADGSMAFDEYAYVPDLESFDDYWDDVELIRETVEVVLAERIVYRPAGHHGLCSACEGEGELPGGAPCERCEASGSEPEWPENPRGMS